MARILVPIPSRDFDPTETGVPWRNLTQRGHDICFATPDGTAGEADPLMVTGRGLGLLAKPSDFHEGPKSLQRDTLARPETGFTVRDGNYLSARWPGDAHAFALAFDALLRER